MVGNAGRAPFNVELADVVWGRLQNGESPSALARELKCSRQQIYRYRDVGYSREKLAIEAEQHIDPRVAWEAGRHLAVAQVDAIISVGAEIIRAERELAEKDRGATPATAGISPLTYAQVAPIVLRAIQEHNRLNGYYLDADQSANGSDAPITKKPGWMDPDPALVRELGRP
jgi:hypothetical protein